MPVNLRFVESERDEATEYMISDALKFIGLDQLSAQLGRVRWDGTSTSAIKFWNCLHPKAVLGDQATLDIIAILESRQLVFSVIVRTTVSGDGSLEFLRADDLTPFEPPLEDPFTEQSSASRELSLAEEETLERLKAASQS